MKKILYLLCLFFVFCDNPSSNVTEKGMMAGKSTYENSKKNAIISFDRQEHDYGDIENGKTYTYEFKFTNKGEIPLVIFNVKTSCGCTVPEFSKEPISPGKQGFLKVNFTPNGKGHQSKSITIISNSILPEQQLSIKANVK